MFLKILLSILIIILFCCIIAFVSYITLFKKIDGGNTSEVCLWSAECVISGYLDELWEKSLEYYVKYININSSQIICSCNY